MALVKAFLKAGILGEDGALRDTHTGAPQGGILSPVLANVALSVLDEHVAGIEGGPNSTPKQRFTRRRKGKANYRLVRYADDFLIMVSGNREHAMSMRAEVAEVLAPMGLRLSVEKTRITHIDEGLDFLGWRIQRHRKRGTAKHYVYTYPSKKALRAVMAKVKAEWRKSVNLSLPSLLHKLNPMLRGWCAYFRPGVSSATFQYLAHYVWWAVMRWARRKHRRITWKTVFRLYCDDARWPTSERGRLFNPAKVSTTRYRYRGAAIPTPWPAMG